ncbi:MAG: hypothetical protein HXX13_05885 [Bacteroidetes bacterium]|nr:hypothetical protein [Bacteroidota bacterium]
MPNGELEICIPEEEIISRLQNLLPFGIMPFEQAVNGAGYGIVMCCGEKEVNCLKQQPIEVERSHAEQLMQIQHLMIVDAYCRYSKMGFQGAYLAGPYLRQRDIVLWEAGVSHFIFPDFTEMKASGKSRDKLFDEHFGIGATRMFFGFGECYKRAFKESEIPMLQYFGYDVRSRSHLQNLAMNFMVLDSRVICLRANLRKDEDAAWTILAAAGINRVYHLPSVPLTIPEPDQEIAKGLL